MLSPAYIQEMQAEVAGEAAKKRKTPFVIFPEDVGNVSRLRHIPSIGTYLPKGWARVDPKELGYDQSDFITGTIGEDEDGPNKRVQKYWVDSSGFGGPDEMALTAQQFADLIQPGFGYAIVEEGQFQVGIGVFRKL